MDSHRLNAPRLTIPPAERTQEERDWIDPDVPLPKGSLVRMAGVYPIGAARIWLAAGGVLLLLCGIQIVDDLRGDGLGFGGLGAGLGGLGILAFGWRQRALALDHAALVESGRWRQGILLLEDNLVLYDNQERLSVFPRSCVVGPVYASGRSRAGVSGLLLRYCDEGREWKVHAASEGQADSFRAIEAWVERGAGGRDASG